MAFLSATSRRATTRLLLAALTVAALVSGCAGRNVRGPFRNQYVEADTGKPIEGVVFLAVWYSVTPNLVSGGTENFYEAREAVSDADGRVEIPALTGPIWRIALNVRFREFAPEGYVAKRVQLADSHVYPYVATTTTLMRRLKTVVERCQRLPFESAMSADAAQLIPRYRAALRREASILQCAELRRGSP